MRTRTVIGLVVVLTAVGCIGVTKPQQDPRLDHWGVKDMSPAAALKVDDPACESTSLVSTGRPQPSDPETLAIRWTGFANFELAYKGQVILLDAYFDRSAI